MTDEELVARASGGDRAAFGELVVRHQAAVYRAARTVLAEIAPRPRMRRRTRS